MDAKYVIIGLREGSGDLAVFDRVTARPDKAEAQRICQSFNYTQLLVVEAKVSGYAQRYEYNRVPTIRAVPLTRPE